MCNRGLLNASSLLILTTMAYLHQWVKGETNYVYLFISASNIKGHSLLGIIYKNFQLHYDM